MVHPSSDETYLTVRLSPDRGGLYVDISDPSGKDRKDDAVAVAGGARGDPLTVRCGPS